MGGPWGYLERPVRGGNGDLIGTDRYERTAERDACCIGHYGCGLTTSPGEVTIYMPKLKGARFATAIIETAGGSPPSRRR